MAIRAGGHVDHGDGRGWVLDAPGRPGAGPTPAPEPAAPAAVPAVAGPAASGRDPDAPDPQGPAETAGSAEPARAECPNCGKEFAVNKDGSLRKHTCVIDAPPPQVTFDGEE